MAAIVRPLFWIAVAVAFGVALTGCAAMSPQSGLEKIGAVPVVASPMV